MFNRFLFSFSSSPTHISDWHLIFPGCEGKEMRNHTMKKRANENVKTQNDWSLHAALRNERGGPKDSIFFFWRRGRRKISGAVECTGIQSFPPFDIRPCMEECGEYACLYYDRKLLAH